VGSAVYRILAAQVDRRNTETLALRFTVRMTNNERFPVLQVREGDESTEIPVDLSGKPRG